MTRTQHLIWSALFLFFSLVHIGFFVSLKFMAISDLGEKILREKKSLEIVQAEETKLLSPELKSTFEKYSKGVLAIENIFAGRDQIFLGNLEEEDYDPVVILSYPDFFQDFQKMLEKHTVIESLSIDHQGKVSFLLESTSFGRVGAQIELLRRGLKKTPLFRNFEVSHIAARTLAGKRDEVPKVFESYAAVYGALIEARINPDFYLPLE